MPGQVAPTVFAFLPSANVVCEGYAFTPVCYSVHMWGGVCLNACWDTHPRQTPPQADTPQVDTPGQTHPLGRHPPGRHHPLGRHPQADTPLDRHPPGQTPPAQCMLRYTAPAQCMLGYTVPSACWNRHGYCCGRYASYWNAFLL